MISVGYGDITPKNTPEVLITVFTMFVSCIVFAYSINTIWEVIREVNESKHSYYKKVTAINRFMHDNKVNNKL
jgi:potassium voltage-gated channel Eag-related subfamily H protein 1/potassium voltage-gated channel Eag-related subfamily H protein 5